MNDDPADLLRRHALRVTPQRRAIIRAFAGGAAEHLSAEEVHARAMREVPELSRGTVYATLAELTEVGVLGSVGAPEPVRYETNVEPHQHFRCRVCLRVFDVAIDPPALTKLRREGFEVERVAILAEGVCSECHEYERGLKDGVDSVVERRTVGDTVLGTLACAPLETTLGTLALGASDVGIVRIAFDHHADFEPLIRRARTRRGSRAARARVDAAAAAIEALLGGSESQAVDVLDPAGRAAADQDALEALRSVPYGSTASYETLDLDLSPYRRGYAYGTNPMPLILPCHRITRGVERPEVYVGGGDLRRRLLDAEAARHGAR
jgi:Fe2+ or Zn2+ uptake regulation protein/O6-methylguanine-DNA--protein-cysteine methyltransferase